MAGLAQCQRQAEEVAELMRQNVARALERDGHLRQLDTRTRELRAMSEAFTRSTRAVARQRQGGRGGRWRLLAFGLAALLLLLVVLALALALWLARAAPPAAVTTIATPPPPPPTPPRAEQTPQ